MTLAVVVRLCSTTFKAYLQENEANGVPRSRRMAQRQTPFDQELELARSAIDPRSWSNDPIGRIRNQGEKRARPFLLPRQIASYRHSLGRKTPDPFLRTGRRSLPA